MVSHIEYKSGTSLDSLLYSAISRNNVEFVDDSKFSWGNLVFIGTSLTYDNGRVTGGNITEIFYGTPGAETFKLTGANIPAAELFTQAQDYINWFNYFETADTGDHPFIDLLANGGFIHDASGAVGSVSLVGSSGNDQFIGSAQNDFFYGSTGKDSYDGGEGHDELSFRHLDENVYVNLGTGAGRVGRDRITVENIEDLKGGTGNDRLYGNDADNELIGGRGNDRLLGRDGDDFLEGDGLDFPGTGNDVLIGGNGNDELWGDYYTDGYTNYDQGGDDRLYGGNGDDKLVGGVGNDRLYGGNGDDEIYAYLDQYQLLGDNERENNELYGGRGNDKLYGAWLDDKLYGGSGNDYMEGKAGSDVLYGGNGNDTLHAGHALGDDHDILNGGSGDDILTAGFGGTAALTGGGGRDRFVVDLHSSHVAITDFRSGFDKIELSQDYLTGFDSLSDYASDTADGVLFEFDSLESLLIEDVRFDDLTADDFIL